MYRKMGLIIAMGVVSLGASCSSKDYSAEQILEKSAAAYRAQETFVIEGASVRESEGGGMKTTLTTQFLMGLKKPDRYRITWMSKTQETASGLVGAIWKDGAQPYLYMEPYSAYWPVDNDAKAFDSAAYAVSNTIPLLFLDSAGADLLPFSRLTEPVLKGSETIHGEDCHVISSPSSASKEETYWISKSSYLIRQYRYSLETPEGWQGIPKMTDDEFNSQLQALGQQMERSASDEESEELMEKISVLVKANLKGSVVEVYETISSPDLSPEEVVYAPPEGTVRSESLLDAVIQQQESIPPLSMQPDAPAGDSAEPSDRLNNLPAIDREEALISSCINNLKQCGLIFKMFANESTGLMGPALSPIPGHLMWKTEDIYPEYMADPTVLICPADSEKLRHANELADSAEKAVFCTENSSYWYLGYAIPDEATGLAFVAAYKQQAATGADFEDDLQDADGNPILQLREGIEHIINYEGSDQKTPREILAQLPLMIERPGHHADKVNVIYTDGHAETLTYPGEFPVSQPFIEALQSLDALRHE